ncbi:MAG TPA: DUF948 domain-containing protein [Actinomycetota bacterium]|nr:DUF948 domain-containing protein [Actinomycetota bacterium]
MIANTSADVALLLLASGWVVLVAFLAIVMLSTFRVMESTKTMIDEVREETVPLLSEVKTTVVNVNKELERADTIIESAGRIAGSASRITMVVEQTVSNPLIKFAAFAAGAQRAIKRMRGPG